MGFEGFFHKHQQITCWLLLILGYVLFITPSYSHESSVNPGEFGCNEEDSGKFYRCVEYKERVLMFCGFGLHFDPSVNNCNWPNANDRSTQIPQSETTKLNDVSATKPPTHSQTTRKVELTGPCQPEKCQLPNCKCPGPEIPYSLPTNATPQIILLTFDDGVHAGNIDYYRDLFGANITNPNGCPIQATFFVSGDYTNYGNVKELYDQGHEIASHSKTHRSPDSFWWNADYKTYVDEIVGMKNWLSTKANIPAKDIRGMRSPFLAIGKDNQMKMLKDYGFDYDSSMVTGSLSVTTEIPTWPFTLDYPVNSKYCALRSCPKKSYPGLWEVPLIRWYNDKTPCAMPDSCRVSSESVLNYLKDNFNRHYKTNKAPFGIFLHAPWLRKNLKPLKKFLEEVSLNNDVWIVNVFQALQWIQNPVPLNNIAQFKSWNCK